MTGKIPLLAAILLLITAHAQAQKTERIYRVGFLRVSAPPVIYIDAFQESMRKLGYVEGKNSVNPSPSSPLYRQVCRPLLSHSAAPLLF